MIGERHSDMSVAHRARRGRIGWFARVWRGGRRITAASSLSLRMLDDIGVTPDLIDMTFRDRS